MGRFRVITTGVVATLVLALLPLACPGQTRDHPETVALGASLFTMKELSQDGTTSCATCHDPLASFADGRPDAIGRMAITTGRNSPTLFAIGHVTAFRDPAQSERAKPGRKPRVLDLAARCLAPMENPLEMGADPQRAVVTLRKIEGMDRHFDAAFRQNGPGVTVPRIGKALAAYVRSLSPPPTPYGRWLRGDQTVLSATERQGLAVFDGKGRCTACHSGPALTDGLMHVADPFDGQRIKDRERAAAERRMELLRREIARSDPRRLAYMTPAQISMEADEMAHRLPGGGGYDPSFVEVQTTTLWDVARTGPYFRDGSVRDLDDAVRIHLAELREVTARAKESQRAVAVARKSGMSAPKKLRAPWTSVRKQPTPASLSNAEHDALVAFLRTLSPRRGKR